MARIEIAVEKEMAPFLERLTTKRCVLRQGVLGESAALLSSVLPRGRWLVAMDEPTRRVAGDAVLQSLVEAEIAHEIWMIEAGEGEEVPVADDRKIEHLRVHLAVHSFVGAVAVGAGTINDIVKMATYQAGIPYAVMATAPSMNGYTSAIAAILSEGVKTTQACHAPVGCFCDLDVMAQAPMRMIASGIGDLLSKPVSSADWRLSYRLNGSFYSKEAMILVDAAGALLEGIAPRLPERDVQAVGQLSASLCLSGLSMSVAGSSSPASGGEHLISHYIDMTHYAYGEGHDFHGCQVAVGTISTAWMYEQLGRLRPEAIDVEACVGALQPWGVYEPLLRARFGKLYEAVEPHAKAGYPTPEQLRARLMSLKGSWDDILRDVQETLRSAQSIRAELEEARCPVRFAEIGVGRERAYRAVAYCKDIRARYTILHLAWEIGLLEPWTEGLLAAVV